VHLVEFIIRIYHDARSPERHYHDARPPECHYVTMHGHLNVTISRCTATWTSLYHDSRPPERHYITIRGHLNATISRCTTTWTSLYHDARPPERHYITMHGHLSVTLSRCTVTWTWKENILSAIMVRIGQKTGKNNASVCFRSGSNNFGNVWHKAWIRDRTWYRLSPPLRQLSNVSGHRTKCVRKVGECRGWMGLYLEAVGD
jgi:hypothetical protein